jgi:hypothetical protein
VSTGKPAAADSAPTTLNGGLGELNPGETNLLRVAREIWNGTIEKLKIQDGVPVFAEETVIKKNHKLT